MDLSTFLNDESLGGSWADDDVDFNAIQIPSKGGNFGATGIPSGGANPKDPAFGGNDRFGGAPRREYQEYPVPDAPPFRARINNLPWDVSEADVAEYVEASLEAPGAIERISAPKDMADPSRLKGFAFVTLSTKEQLEKIITFSGQEMNGRRVYIAVAAPDKEGGFRGSRFEDDNLDWGSARGSGFASRGGDRGDREDRPKREEPNLDWGSARGSGFVSREPREPREPRPKKEEPNLDWGSARGSGFAAREPREPREPRDGSGKKEEPNLDWSSARGSGFAAREPREPREPREARPKKEEPNLDWSSARGSGFTAREPREPREHTERKPKKEEPSLDWGAARSGAAQPLKSKAHTKNEPETWARGQPLPARSSGNRNTTQKQEAPKPVAKKSAFAVLAGDDDDEEEEDDEQEELVEKTQNLSV
ncbi:Eukaryotic translation initiation factor 4B [Cyberlindnera fabianii]|nr:Eukaryotic translation initiation factor 4B [Cyberlindnera fabianii]